MKYLFLIMFGTQMIFGLSCLEIGNNIFSINASDFIKDQSNIIEKDIIKKQGYISY